jgi:hypothetical protein
MARVREITAVAMAHVDLLVVLPLDDCDGIRVPDDEDPELRTAMDERLLDLVDDPELVGSVGTVLAVSGSPRSRLRQVLVAVQSSVR